MNRMKSGKAKEMCRVVATAVEKKLMSLIQDRVVETRSGAEGAFVSNSVVSCQIITPQMRYLI